MIADSSYSDQQCWVCVWAGCVSGLGVCLGWVCVWAGCVSGLGVCLGWVCVWAGCVSGLGVCLGWVCVWAGFNGYLTLVFMCKWLNSMCISSLLFFSPCVCVGYRLDLSSMLPGRLQARATGDADTGKLSCMVRGHHIHKCI